MMIPELLSWWRTRRIRAKHKAAALTGARYYGSGGTIHQTGYLDVEIYDGQVVSVWFRCMPLPFRQANIKENRAKEMSRLGPVKHIITGVEIKEIPE